MAGAKEIRTKIASVKKTQKITRAMEMVAASKMRKTQQQGKAAKPYATKIYEVVSHIARANSEYHHPFMNESKSERPGIVVVTTDRGLCGGLNTNLLREAIRFIRTKNTALDANAVELGIIGRKGQAFFKRVGGKVIASLDHVGDYPHLQDLVGLVKVLLDAYYRNEIDSVYIAHNEFVNTMVQRPLIKQLLPLPKLEQQMTYHRWDYIYEPDARELLDALFERYIELQVYQGVVENIACEQAAKMIAMKNATDNAGEVIKEFQLAYNKARQAAITQELSEIVGGAAAL